MHELKIRNEFKKKDSCVQIADIIYIAEHFVVLKGSTTLAPVIKKITSAFCRLLQLR